MKKRFNVSLLFILSILAIVSCNSRHVADTTKPTILSVSPYNGATEVAITTAVTCTFSEAMDASTINNMSFLLVSVSSTTTTPIPGAPIYDISSNVATFTPTSPLSYNTQYTATITTTVTDAAGNAIESSYFWSFRTIPSPGSLDASFGTGGTVRAALSSGNDIAYAGAIQQDGKIITAGLSSEPTGSINFTIARFLVNGTLDTTFNPPILSGKNDYFTGKAFAVALQSDDKIVAAGASGDASSGSNSHFLIARYNANGSRDTTFGNGSSPDGSSIVNMGGIDSAHALAIQTDGNVIVTGESTTNNGNTYQTVIARLNTDGTLDNTFGNKGIVINSSYATSHAYAVKIQDDGMILVGGIFKGQDENTPGPTSSYIMRYDKTGKLDPLFGSGGVVTVTTGTNTAIAAMEILPSDGKILIAGTTMNILNGTDDLFLMRFNSDGSLDANFGSNGIVTTDDVNQGDDIAAGLAIQPDGKIVVAAKYLPKTGSNPNYDFALFRYSADGVLDTTFGIGGFGMVTTDLGSSNNDFASGVQIQQDGKIVVVGWTLYGSKIDLGLARYWP